MTLALTYGKIFFSVQIMSEDAIEIRDHFALQMHVLCIIYDIL